MGRSNLDDIVRIRQHMGYLLMSQAELAQRVGITNSHISHVFHGRRSFSPEVLERINRELGIASEAGGANG